MIAVQLPRLRWVLGGEKWPDPLWLTIGLLLILLGLAMIALGVAIMAGVIEAPWRGSQRRHASSAAIFAILVAWPFIHLGWVETRDALARMRGQRH